ECRWENLKDNPKRMINSVLDYPKKLIIMNCLIREIPNKNTHVITEEETIKKIVKDYFHD
ncbi:78_t:CDS:1, partial [Diversispora eburnea]